MTDKKTTRAMIELVDVTKTYKMGESELTVLHGISLQIHSGELVAIIGPSGSGKSTMMNIIGLLDRPTTGQYYLNDSEVSQLSSDQLAELRNRTIGFIFQSFFLLPRMTAIQNVCLPLTYRNIPMNEIRKRAMKNLEKVGVGQLAKHKPSEMSGGQQQRVAIARALIGGPSLILADEPTGALDSFTSQEVMNLLIQLNTEEKATIAIVTHDPSIAEQCTRVIEVRDGKIAKNK